MNWFMQTTRNVVRIHKAMKHNMISLNYRWNICIALREWNKLYQILYEQMFWGQLYCDICDICGRCIFQIIETSWHMYESLSWTLIDFQIMDGRPFKGRLLIDQLMTYCLLSVHVRLLSKYVILFPRRCISKCHSVHYEQFRWDLNILWRRNTSNIVWSDAISRIHQAWTDNIIQTYYHIPMS